jgi:hypothetical protein
MNDNKKIIAGTVLTVAAIVLSIREYIEIRRVEREVRAKIEADTAAEIKAMDHASKLVIERIKEGKYDGRGIGPVWNDFKFETIIHRIDE